MQAVQILATTICDVCVNEAITLYPEQMRNASHYKIIIRMQLERKIS